MDFDFIIKMKDMISFYLKCIDIEMNAENLTAQEYFEKYDINDFYLRKTCAIKNYKAVCLTFILKKAYELGYLTNPSDDILKQVNAELKNKSFPEHNNHIAECSADLD